MRLEVGKRYIDGAGRICLVKLDDGCVGEARFKVDHGERGTVWHYEDGRSTFRKEEDLRLVSEVADTVSKIKVGDLVRIVGNSCGHNFNIGKLVTIIDDCGNHYEATDGRESWFISTRECEPVNTLQLNQTYTSANGDKWECIAIKGDVAWLAGVYSDEFGAGYKFKLDGTSICLTAWDDRYNIVFGPFVETKETTVTIEGRPVHLEYTKTDGVFDYSSVTPVVPF